MGSLILALALSLAASGFSRQEEPVRLDEIVLLLQSGMTVETIAALIQARGVAGPLTVEQEDRLRALGATEALLDSIRVRPAPPPDPSESRAPGHGNKPDPGLPGAGPYQFAVDTNVVTVPVSVTDKMGRPVTDLKQEEFRLAEDGAPQPIAYFSTERRLFRIGILLDVSGSMEEKLDAVADALKHFQDLLEPEDEIFVLTFSGGVQMVQDFTSDRRRLGAILERLSAAGGTALYDAVIEGLSHLADVSSESKALVVITDGMDTASVSSLKDALEAARRFETPVYSIGLGHRRGFLHFGTAHGASGSTDFDERPLLDLAEESGGRAEILVDVEHHHKGKVDRLKDAAEAIALTLRQRYLIGYHPPDNAKPGWRKIRVEVDRGSVAVRARKGYYSTDPLARPSAGPQSVHRDRKGLFRLVKERPPRLRRPRYVSEWTRPIAPPSGVSNLTPALVVHVPPAGLQVVHRIVAE